MIDSLVRRAHALGASDLHLEPGLPAAVRVDGRLRMLDTPLSASDLQGMARALLPGEAWASFVERRSADLSKTLGGVRCRLNVFQTSRGVGLAIRLLTAFRATLETLNLHPDLVELTRAAHGLVLVSGPTGSGKSSTIAAMVQEINLRETRHIVTVEQPVEHVIRPQLSLVRQREVGRDTPSFEQALLDVLREDPDVVVVGEMRCPETMRLTLNTAETGHLVFTTVHSATCTEALHRVIAAFAPEAQPAVCSQLADCLVAVLCQRLVLHPTLGMRVPELEILMATDPVRASVRSNQLHKLVSIAQMGAVDGSWSRERYRRWLDQRERFFVPRQGAGEPLPPDPEPEGVASGVPLPIQRPRPTERTARPTRPAPSTSGDAGVIDLDGQVEDLASILSEL